MSAARCLTRPLRSACTPTTSCIATRTRQYSAAAAAAEDTQEHEQVESAAGSSSKVPANSVSPTPTEARNEKSFRPIGYKNRAAYETAKSNAEALRRSILHGEAVKPETSEQTGPVASSSALGPARSKIEQSPTLETLEKYRPERLPNPFGPKYKKRYDKVWWSVATAFLRKQLFKLAKEMGFKGSHRKTTKEDLIVFILRSWEWRPPVEIEAELKAIAEARRPVERVIPLSHMEMFVLLRKSPRVLSEIGDRNDVTITMSQAPELGLRANGTSANLAHLETILNDMKKNISHEYFHKDDVGGVEARWLPAVAETTGAFIEALPAGMYKISSTGGRQAEEAKNLIRTAWLKNTHFAQSSALVASTSDTPKPLAMYPFLPAPASALDWDAPSTPLFRVRTVGTWFTPSTPAAEIGGGLEIVRNQGTSLPSRYEALLLKPLLGPANATRRLRAKLGHILHTSADAEPSTSILSSPLPGQWRLQALQQWVQAGTTIFTPSLSPQQSQRSPPPLSTATRSRRLLYREFGTDKFIALDVEYPPPSASESVEPKSDWAAELDALLEGLDDIQEEASERELESEPVEVAPVDLKVSARYGVLAQVDVMLPDRAVDVRLIMEESVDMDPPPQFAAFIQALSTQSDPQAAIVPPRIINAQMHGKVTYELFEDFDAERHLQDTSSWWTSKKDMLANGQETAPELVIEQPDGDARSLMGAVGEASSTTYGPPSMSTWSPLGSS